MSLCHFLDSSCKSFGKLQWACQSEDCKTKAGTGGIADLGCRFPHAIRDDEVQDWDDIAAVGCNSAPQALDFHGKGVAMLLGDVVHALQQSFCPATYTNGQNNWICMR